MADAITYCDRCGRMILPSDVAQGNYLRLGDGAMCTDCAATLSPEQRASVEAASTTSLPTVKDVASGRATPRPGRLSPPRGAAAVRGRPPTRSHAKVSAPRGSGAVVIGGTIGGILLGVAVALVLITGPGEKDEREKAYVPVVSPPLPGDGSRSPAVDPETKPAATTDATAALAKIREKITPDLAKYDDIVVELKYFKEEHEGAPEVAEAAKLLAKVEEDYATAAEAELGKVTTDSIRLAAEGKHDAALSILRAVGARYRGSAWFTSGGEQKVAEAVAAIEKLRPQLAARPAVPPPPVGTGSFAYHRGAFPAGTTAEVTYSTERSHPAANVVDGDESTRVNGRPQSIAGNGKASLFLRFPAVMRDVVGIETGQGDEKPNYFALRMEFFADTTGDGAYDTRVGRADNLDFSHGGRGEHLFETVPDEIHGLELRVVQTVRAMRRGFIQHEVWPLFATSRGAKTEWAKGLRGEYFNGARWHDRTLVTRRLDAGRWRLDWRDSPAPGVNADLFSVRWTGQIKIPADGTYHFEADHDDRGVLLIDGHAFDTEGMRSRSTLELRAGWLPIRIDFGEDHGNAIFGLSWWGPGFARRQVESDDLRTLVVRAPAPAGAAYRMVGGRCVIEAEDFTAVDRRGDRFDWVVAAAHAGFVGAGYVCTDGVPNRASWDGACEVTYSLEFAAPGSYWLAVRAWAPDGNGDSLRVGIDGVELRQPEDFGVAIGTDREWQWARARLPLEVRTPGRHTLHVRRRESRLCVDRIMVASEQDALPAGRSTESGPPASPRARYVAGIRGEYYKGKGFDPAKLAATRIDESLYFEFLDDHVEEVGRDVFSVRWTGEIEIPSSGAYEFHLSYDNGASCTIGGTTLTSDFGVEERITKTVTVDLEAGWTPIGIDLYEHGGESFFRLSWKGPGIPTRVRVPASAFRTLALPGEMPTGGATAAPTRGLVAHWKFDEGRGNTARNAVRGSPDGRIKGGTWVEGVRGGAISFDGNGEVSVPNAPALEPGHVTVSVWIKLARPLSGMRNDYCGFADKDHYPSKRGFNLLGLRKSVNTFAFRTMDGAVSTARCTDDRVGVWIHLAGVHDGRQTAIYIDGVQRGHADRSGRVRSDGNVLLIGNHFVGSIDDLRIYDRALSAVEILALASPGAGPSAGASRAAAADRGRPPIDASAEPARDGYALSNEVIAALRAARAGKSVKAKTLSAVGGPLSASPSFDAELRRGDLSTANGYRFPRGVALGDSRIGVDVALKAVESFLERERLELVRICFDESNIKPRASQKGFDQALEKHVAVALRVGTVPVLFTVPAYTGTGVEKATGFANYNKAVVKAAKQFALPYVDATRILNEDETKARTYFDNAGRLGPAAFDAINQRFAKLYRVLERGVFDRDSAADAAAQDASRTGAPARARSADNLAPNAGFEEYDEEARMPTGWRSRVWGGEDARASVGVDAATVHGGERSAVVKGAADGARPGLSASLGRPLRPGTYEVTFWAKADVGRPARVGMQLGGLPPFEVGIDNEFQEYRTLVVVTKMIREPELRLWTSTPGVRVFFDDVIVKRGR